MTAVETSRTATLARVSIATGRGSIDYTPGTNVTGVGRFDYTITDANGATGVATVTIGAVSDRPVAVDDFASTNEAMPVTIDMVANDTDEDGGCAFGRVSWGFVEWDG